MSRDRSLRAGQLAAEFDISTKDGMVDPDRKVAESGVAVNTVKSSTIELKKMLEEQTAIIEQST